MYVYKVEMSNVRLSYAVCPGVQICSRTVLLVMVKKYLDINFLKMRLKTK